MKIDYVTLFCFVDDFCRGFDAWYRKQLISDGTLKRDRRGHLLLSEIMTILISYHQLEWPVLNTFIFLYFRTTIPYFLGSSIMIGS